MKNAIPQLKLKSLQTFLAIKHCRQTNILKVINPKQNKLAHICANSDYAVSGFLSGTIDFWIDSHCMRQFGCFIVDMIAEKYEQETGQILFMSRMTRSRLQDDIFAYDHGTPKLGHLE
jgi:hypothetical protein